MNTIEQIGYHGPRITVAITAFALFDQIKYLTMFIVFYLVEYYLNGVLKQMIRQPRPRGYLDDKNDDGGTYTGKEQYGMPSGHSMSVWYSTIFLWLVKKNPYLLLLELAIGLNTMYQRWAFKKHSVEQILVGSVLGGSLAWTAFALTKYGITEYGL